MAALSRVDETLIAAAVGVLVNLLTPPLHVQSAEEAIGELAGRIQRLLRDIGAELEQEWTHERAQRWLCRPESCRWPSGRPVRPWRARAEESLRAQKLGVGELVDERVKLKGPGRANSGIKALTVAGAILRGRQHRRHRGAARRRGVTAVQPRPGALAVGVVGVLGLIAAGRQAAGEAIVSLPAPAWSRESRAGRVESPLPGRGVDPGGTSAGGAAGRPPPVAAARRGRRRPKPLPRSARSAHSGTADCPNTRRALDGWGDLCDGRRMRTHRPVPWHIASSDTRARPWPRETAPSALTRLLGLQRLAGNSAVASLIGDATVQRDDKPSGQAPNPPAGKSIELIFIIRKPNDQFTKDMTDYVKTTLKGHEYREVANIEDICAEATKLAAQGITLSKVRIVGHGQTVQGGVGMTPAKEKKWRYVQPAEVKAYMSTPECKGLRGAMAKNAEVEFWGCYLGGLPQAGEAWADLFGKPVRSTKGEIKIGRDEFLISGKQAAKSVKDVPAGARKQFRKWLLDRYQMLRASGEAPFLKTEDEQVGHMTQLFDSSGGRIRSRVVQEKGSVRVRRPGEEDELDIWETVHPNQ